MSRHHDEWLLLDGCRRYRQLMYLAEHNELGDTLNTSAIPCFVKSSDNISDAMARLETNETPGPSAEPESREIQGADGPATQ